MEGLLRQGQEQALTASAEALSRALLARPGALPERGPALFVHELAQRPLLDGHLDDWRAIVRRRFASADGGSAFSLALGRYEDSLYLAIEVEDRSPQRADAHWPGAAAADHLQFALDGSLGRLAFRIANAASGPLRVVAVDGGPAPLRLVGAWRDHPGGYRLEWQLPQGLAPERLGFEWVDADPTAAARRAGTGIDAPEALWPLNSRNDRLARPIAPLLPAATRARLIDPEGWILAEVGELPIAGPADALPWWRRQLYQWLLFGADPRRSDQSAARRSDAEEIWQALSGRAATAWRRDQDAPRLLLSAAVPVSGDGGVRGALLLEREQQTLLLTDRAVGGVLGVTLLAWLAVGLVLLSFASRLGWRIRHLRDATENALERDGRVRTFPHSRDGDEIGDLSRSFARLLAEIAASQDYLRSLAGKLSHELNTPIAIVRGALDNLDGERLAAADRTCVERARGGVERLSTIVRAMSEAGRFEQAIGSADAEEVDLAALIATLADGYRQLLAPRALQLALPDAPLLLHCAPELIVQALDKLIDNARGFTPEDGWVRIMLSRRDDGALVQVANQGPRLPAAMQHRLFDSMVSLREARRDGVHLGFGLYLVRLVAELHRGQASAADLADSDGVEFSLRLRALRRG
jgi:two-component system, OmpR family, sensor histidine kinase ChvG